MSKQDYLEMFKFHFVANEKIRNENDLFEIVISEDLSERINRNEQSMEHARSILKTYFKTFDEEMINYARQAA